MNNAHISSYVVTVDPPIAIQDNGVIEKNNVQFQTREIILVLQHGQQYDISVRAASCANTLEGIASTPLIINVQGNRQ